MEGAYCTYMDLYGVDFLNDLGLVLFLWLPLTKRAPQLMCKSWLNLAWYTSSSGCPVSNHGQVSLRLDREGREHI